MRVAVFVAPFFAETTVRFVAAATRLAGVRVGLVSQDPLERLEPAVRRRLAGHMQVDDALDAAQIERALARIEQRLGPCQRLVGALEELQEPLAAVRERRGIEGLGVREASNFRDKSQMKDVLRRAGVGCARHGLAASVEQTLGLAREIGFPLVAKPPAGAGARNTLRVDGPEALRECLELLRPAPGHELLLEEYVVGEEHSLDSVTIGGTPVWHSLTHYTPGPLEVMRNPWIQWTVLLPREVDHPRYDDIRGLGERALRALGMVTGLSHMEWFRRPDGSIAISEVAARPPGAQFTTLMSHAYDVDFYAAWARLVILDRFEPPPRRFAAGIAFLRGQGRGRVRRVAGLELAQRELGGLVVEARLPRAGQRSATGYEGEGFVVLRHRDTAVVERGLRRLVQLLRVELA